MFMCMEVSIHGDGTIIAKVHFWEKGIPGKKGINKFLEFKYHADVLHSGILYYVHKIF